MDQYYVEISNTSSHLIFEHLFMDAEVCIGVKVVIFAGHLSLAEIPGWLFHVPPSHRLVLSQGLHL